MTIVTNWYTMDCKEGVNLNQVQTISTTSNPDYPAPNAKLGDRVQGNNGSEWVFVQASTTVTQFMAVAIDNTFKANDLTSALISSGVYSYGIAEFQLGNPGSATVGANVAQPNDYFWALLKANGGVAINISPSATRGTILYLAPGAPGQFTSSALSGYAADNMQIVASIGTSASGPAEAILRSYIQFPANVSWIGAVGSA